MENFGLVAALFIVMFAVLSWVSFQNTRRKARLTKMFATLPSVHEYLKRQPSKHSAGVTCSQCGSNQLGSVLVLKHPYIGLTTPLGFIQFCRRCRTNLYTTPAE